jgi:hypothetical protein
MQPRGREGLDHESSFNQSQELHARFALSAKDASHDGGSHQPRRANTARRHAEMLPFEHHRHVLRPGDPTDLIGNLLSQPLLQLQAMSKLLRNPRKFREAQRRGVSRSPSRSGSSPMASSNSRPNASSLG